MHHQEFKTYLIFLRQHLFYRIDSRADEKRGKNKKEEIKKSRSFFSLSKQREKNTQNVALH